MRYVNVSVSVSVYERIRVLMNRYTTTEIALIAESYNF